MSYSWRRIVSVQEKFSKGIGVKIGNRESTSFQFDNWFENNRPLIELIPSYKTFVDVNKKVIDYVDSQREWDRNKLSR